MPLLFHLSAMIRMHPICTSKTVFRVKKRSLKCAFTLLTCLVLHPLNAVSQRIFSPELHRIDLKIEEEQWFDSLQVYYDQALNGAKKKFLSVQAVFDGDTLQNVGLRFKGKYSNYGFPGKKKPFRLDFNKFVDAQEFQGLKKLNLHNLAGDPSFLREYMAYDLMRYLGVKASRTSFTELYINGAYWGCYEIAEEPDKQFLKYNFNTKKGNLFECIKTTSLSWNGDHAADYPQLELKTDSTATSWIKLIEWLDLINNYHGIDYQRQLSEQFDMNSYMRILATDVIINNNDAYSSNGRNFFIYDNPEAQKLEWIPWDYNLSFWANAPAPLPKISENYYQPFIYRIVQNKYLKDNYYRLLCHLLDNEYANYPFNQRAESMFNTIREAVEKDTLKFYSNEVFHANLNAPVVVSMLRNNLPTDVYLPGITSLFAKRKNELRKALFIDGCDCDNLKDSKELSAHLYPNPATDHLTIYIENDMSQQQTEVLICDVRGSVIQSLTPLVTGGNITFDVSSFERGVYFIQITSNGKKFTQKWIKL